MSTPVPHPLYAQVGAVGGAVVVVVCARHVPARRGATAAMYLNSILMRVWRAGTWQGKKDCLVVGLSRKAHTHRPLYLLQRVAGGLFKYLGITTFALPARLCHLVFMI